MTQQTSSAIHTLIEIATRDSEHAAEMLSGANKQLKENEKSLSMLLEYRHDYTSKLTQNAQQGVEASSFQNFQGFLQKLDQAIASQRMTVASCQETVNQLQLQWQQCERKKLSYGVIVNHAEIRARQQQLKKEQLAMDEHALRRSLINRRDKTFSR